MSRTDELLLRPWGELVHVRPLDVRPAQRERSLVLSSWILSWAPHARPRLTPAQAAPIVEDHLARCDLVLVAEVPGVTGAICGWVARARPGVLAYVYVVHDYRRRGVAARLLEEARLPPTRRFRYMFGTPRLRELCRFDPKRPGRVTWKGIQDGQSNRSR